MRLFFTICVFLFLTTAYSQPIPIEGKTYTAAGSEPIYMPLGKMSFADSIIKFEMGYPRPLEEYINPQEALGEPDYVHYRVPNYVSLGCYGSLVVEFVDNGFIDMEGPDLYVWEVGPSEENFRLEISTDGKEWRDLGEIAGGKSYIDIAPVVKNSREVFYFVRITDGGQVCTGRTPGTDIDAIGTISGVIKISLSADILFDFDKFNLKDSAKTTIEDLAYQISRVGVAEIIVQGHTDNFGSSEYNDLLSQNRANSVLNRLKENLANAGIYTFGTEAYGKTRPRTTNETDEGRQLNRRVEIVVLPHKDFYTKKEKTRGQ